jgi:serine/threonine protein phosphatase 1
MSFFSSFFSPSLPFTNNPYTISVPKCKGSRYVISDIHGSLNTFKELVRQLHLTPDDQLFLLGDYIDRGPRSSGVIDYIFELQTTFQVFPLLGNHENETLRLIAKNKQSLYIEHVRQYPNSLFDADLKVDQKYLLFFESLPYFIVLDNFILVHAGFDFACKQPNPFFNTEQMLWIRNFDYDATQVQNRRIIHGHTPYSLSEIRSCIAKQSSILPLDNGCFLVNEKDFGNLLCLNIDTMDLFLQKNID